MTDREKAIVMAYTGKCMLTEDKFHIFHEYIEEIMGRPVFTHELADKNVSAEIKEKAKADFIALCNEEESCEDAISRVETVQFLANHSNDFEDARLRMAFKAASSLVNNPHNLPSVIPAQKTGKWIKACTEEKYISLRDKITVSTYMCSECGRMINNIGTGPFASRIEGYPYCHCGAKMIGVEK